MYRWIEKRCTFNKNDFCLINGKIENIRLIEERCTAYANDLVLSTDK